MAGYQYSLFMKNELKNIMEIEFLLALYVSTIKT